MENFSEKMTGVFSGEKLIHNTFLNLLGLQVFRILVGRFFYSLRTMLLFSKLTEEQKILRKDGIIFIKKFLNKNRSRRLEAL